MNAPSKSQLLYEANMDLQKAYAEATRLRSLLATCYQAIDNVCGNLLKDSRTTQYDRLRRLLEEFENDDRLPEHDMRNEATGLRR